MKTGYRTYSYVFPPGHFNADRGKGPVCFLTSNGQGKNFLAVAARGHFRGANDSVLGSTSMHISDDDCGWEFGYLTYNYEPKNRTDREGQPKAFLFKPDIVVEWNEKAAFMHTTIPEAISVEYLKQFFQSDICETVQLPDMLADETRDDYLAKVRYLQQLIRAGDLYEINHCFRFHANGTVNHPFGLFEQLNRKSASPYAAYLSIGDKKLLCTSPESFLKRTGTKLEMTPMKGTARRGLTAIEDNAMRGNLLHSEKERAENIMITDLVRNDLSKVAVPGSVQVEELCGVYSYKTVHQMISKVTASLAPWALMSDILSACFPPGSMTGAPKIRAMQRISETETASRGIYSGCIGYRRPGGDFEFNVVIRTLEIDVTDESLNLWVGSAITSASNPEAEYEECLLKAAAIRELSHAVSSIL